MKRKEEHLFDACRNGDIDTVKLLLNSNDRVDVNWNHWDVPLEVDI